MKKLVNEEFKRMQFLAGIVTENIINEEQEPDFSGLSQVDDIIDAELKKEDIKDNWFLPSSWEIGYNHFVNRTHKNMPQTLKLLLMQR